MAQGIVEISDEKFDADVLKSEKPVLVDFWAPWCGPCRAIGPIVEELAGQMEESVTFAKMNVDENPLTPSKYGIRAIPTLIVFKGGKVVDQITGMVAKDKIKDLVNKAL
ncbi:MAG: thioredoxin [Desulfatibacillaceae bacterium]|nr:thioredoxin [Desulfatibacillaceae bacterium]